MALLGPGSLGTACQRHPRPVSSGPDLVHVWILCHNGAVYVAVRSLKHNLMIKKLPKEQLECWNHTCVHMTMERQTQSFSTKKYEEACAQGVCAQECWMQGASRYVLLGILPPPKHPAHLKDVAKHHAGAPARTKIA